MAGPRSRNGNVIIARDSKNAAEMVRAQAIGYAVLGVAGLSLVLAIGRPGWAGLPGLALALLWLVVVKVRPPHLETPARVTHSRWFYYLVGPLAYACGAVVVIAVAWLLARHTAYHAVGAVAAGVMSAFALGAAAYFAFARIGR